MSERSMANKRRSAVLVGTFALTVAALVTALTYFFLAAPVALAAGVVVGGASAALLYWRSDAIVLAVSQARPAGESEQPRLHNVVEGLCAAAGLPKPRIYVVEDRAPNAFTTGRDPKHAALVVTTGLLETLTPIELEGVVAHELSHVKSHDILPATLAATIVGFPGRVVPTLAHRAMQAAAGPARELAADVAGVTLTRYPPGLISALEKLRGDRTPASAAKRVIGHLWIESPDADPPLDERIEALREL